MNITHLFYHQETVEQVCAENSWDSIKSLFQPNDEVILLDLGLTLNVNYYKPDVKNFVIEKIRTDIDEERSYTYGLNSIIPRCRYEWVVLWRSDYIYTSKYLQAIMKGVKQRGNVVIPYEALIGGGYCKGRWCRRHLKSLINAEEEKLLKHGHVCPVYEMMDFPHFAIKKELFSRVGGMDERLWGYGYQFPDLFWRLKQQKDYLPIIKFDMIAFHQTHKGSFGIGKLNEQKKYELKDSKQKLLAFLFRKKMVPEAKHFFRTLICF